MSPRLFPGRLAAQSDRRLVELVGEGHERAFEVLVQRYRRQLARYCRRMGLSDSRVEDVLQHALLRAWLAMERGTEVRDLRPWLYRIVHNTAVNLMRSSARDHGPLVDAARIDPPAAYESDFERRIAVRDALADVAALPSMQREAILLSAVDGRTHEEVASALGISHGAVRGLLYRARTTLRSAAAAATPLPAIRWACGCVGRPRPTAERLAELSAQGPGAGTSGALLKTVTVAVTAVVLAGGAVAPYRGHGARRSNLPARSAGLETARADTQSPLAHAPLAGVGLSARSAASSAEAGGVIQVHGRGRHSSSPLAPEGLSPARRSAPAPGRVVPAQGIAGGQGALAGVLVNPAGNPAPGSSGGAARPGQGGSARGGETESGSSASDGSGGRESGSEGSHTPEHSPASKASSGAEGSAGGSQPGGSLGGEGEGAQGSSKGEGAGSDGPLAKSAQAIRERETGKSS